MINNYFLIFLIIILILIYFILSKKKNNEHFNDYEDNKEDIDNFYISDNTYSKFNMNNQKILYNYDKINKLINDKYFVQAQYHKDYIDVINSFNDYDGLSPHNKQLFNINNIPVKITKNIKELTKINNIVNSFIDSTNKKIIDLNKNQKDNNINNNTWEYNDYMQNYDDGFKKVQKSLGLPSSLYSDEVKGTKIKLNDFFDIIKYETEQEKKYILYAALSRDKVKDILIIKLSFIISNDMPDNIIIENIDVIGFISNNKISSNYVDINNYYNFDSLEDNNLLNDTKILNELQYKNLIRNKLMQEQIDNLGDIDKKTHNNINPYDYQSYKNTTTINQDITKKNNNY